MDRTKDMVKKIDANLRIWKKKRGGDNKKRELCQGKNKSNNKPSMKKKKDNFAQCSQDFFVDFPALL